MQSLLLLNIAIALLPALLLLALFDRFEAFNLVRLPQFLAYLTVGGMIAGVAYVANGALFTATSLPFATYSQFVAPAVEELLKASPIILLFARNKIGFKIDAAIIGFTIGAGFSIVENAYLLTLDPGSGIGLWMVRGLGTAVMHGGATALFAVVSHEMTDEQAEAKAAQYRFKPWLFVPGLAAAVVMHGGFNMFVDHPLQLMFLAFTIVPLSLFAVLSIGEGAARKWMMADNKVHEELLEDLEDGDFARSEIGQAVCAIADKFNEGLRQEVFDYIRLHTEIVLRAERLMLARGEGERGEPDEDDRARFERLRVLEVNIGRAGLTALRPLLHFSRNDLWEMQMLGKSATKRRGRRPWKKRSA
ncbi:MAG TPA: PrsW family glutamic-type intramembrane protease [Sphingomicrobium sp.]|nr:PrsW family glutamic-type intramembrane protease [Sphingomicrobium sp.]